VVTDGAPAVQVQDRADGPGELRQNGARSLEVACFGCRHEVIVNVDKYPCDLVVKEFGPRMVCTKCGMVGADVRPNWKERAPR
jgi:hypothetical protein